jgi:hypothetical protein
LRDRETDNCRKREVAKHKDREKTDRQTDIQEDREIKTKEEETKRWIDGETETRITDR